MIAKTTHIENTRNLLEILPTVDIGEPEDIFIALENARCPKADLTIKEGDHVKMYQVIGMRHGPFFDQPIHSTVSGTFLGFEKHLHRSGKMVNFIHIKNDFKEEEDETVVHERTPEEIAKLTREDFMQIAKECASVGLGGSSFPTYIKFDTKGREIKTILVNGVECEPYITADKRMMLEKPEEVIEGIKLLQQAFGTKDARLCVKSKYKDIIAIYDEFLRAMPDSGIKVCPVGNFYPQGWEIAMIKSATGIEVASGHLPSEYGIVDFNVSTVVGLLQNVKYNKPVIERFVSVTGDAIKYPSNFSIRVGTPMKYILEKCGGYVHPERKKVFILGGPMMGASIPSDDCICTKTVTSIIVLDHDESKEDNCIRCGSCVLSCPVHLKPVQIMNAVKAMDKDTIKMLEPLKCIECGLCTYSCTSKIQVTDYVRRAKLFAKL